MSIAANILCATLPWQFQNNKVNSLPTHRVEHYYHFENKEHKLAVDFREEDLKYLEYDNNGIFYKGIYFIFKRVITKY